MKYIVVLCLLSISQVVFATRFSSTIHSIDFGKASEPHLVRFDNGRVSFVAPKENELLTSFVSSSERQDEVEVKVDKENNVLAVRTVPSTNVEDDGNNLILDTSSSNSEFKASVLVNNNAALRVFNKMRRDYDKDGQCYSRAHIWAYEEFQRSRLNSMKIFMFFTERYIRKYRFHWWFHVTPMVYVGNARLPRTLDRRYTTGPRMTKTWSDIFIKSKRACPVVKRYDDFWLNQQKEDCYHIRASMHYFIPRDLEKRDLTGIEKSEFKEAEIRRAYRDGFNR